MTHRDSVKLFRRSEISQISGSRPADKGHEPRDVIGLSLSFGTVSYRSLLSMNDCVARLAAFRKLCNGHEAISAVESVASIRVSTIV